ncbi:hypothetical protein SELMODRAFT_417305 [Selaginella moellendorffii]|uniref:Uncharacterized protein n=1 Tax=Selaginella moellendorffii TaxID=88036 RepID=D8S1T2_SELML|nr:hypothetical protein SELMODRAFT_417305 [Selaginella moellendorffii]
MTENKRSSPETNANRKNFIKHKRRTAETKYSSPAIQTRQRKKDLSFMPLSFGSYSPRHSTLGFGALKADRQVRSTRTRKFHARVATGESQVEESVLVLKAAAKSKKIPAPEVFAAFRVLEKACVDPSNFFETLGGSSGAEPRCWMLVFAAGAKVVREALKGGSRGQCHYKEHTKWALLWPSWRVGIHFWVASQ